MKIQISGLANDSIVDGPGLRFTIFTQGCPHHCAGCHNPQTHSIDGGIEMDTDDLLAQIAENPLLDGITLSGGEPFLQCEACGILAQGAHKMGLTVWTYTGFTWEELLADKNKKRSLLLLETDVLVDGPFQLENRSLSLSFCGSKNQRLIAVTPSLAKQNTVILWHP